MSEYSLAISLGHNSSAIAIRNGKIIGGYEEERFTQVKADSSYPCAAIGELCERFDLPPDTDCYISHWFLDGRLPESNKYFDREHLQTMFPDGKLYSLRPDFTHHDAHALSATVFAGKFPTPFHVFVVDGFGTAGECYSVYESTSDDGELKLVWRIQGFHNSIGLYYQYATAFCGMKMHQDEYKMLAYETHVLEAKSVPIDILNELIEKTVRNMMCGFAAASYPECSVTDLPRIQAMINTELQTYIDLMFGGAPSDRDKKIMVAYFVQRLTERILEQIHIMFQPQNLIVSGGVFYNVKVNSMLADMTPGKFCAMPLAGDQGAALGVYQEYRKDLKWPGHLFWGHRSLDAERLAKEPGIVVVMNDDQAMYEVEKELHRVGLVNLVRGSMEFGPRALCNTSTLAIPKSTYARQINEMNDRTNEMPFGLVVMPDQAKQLFVMTRRVHRSLEYMIVTREFWHPVVDDSNEDDLATYSPIDGSLTGGAHYYPLLDRFTCRPQVTSDPRLVELLDKFGPLINTSFNYHGVPIVRSTDEIIFSHMKQRERFPEIKTIVVKED